MGREDMFGDLLDKENRAHWEEIVEEQIERMYGEDAPGIDKEDRKKEITEKITGKDVNSIYRKEMQGEMIAVCIVGVIAIILADILYKNQKKTVYEILKRKGYDEEFAREFIRTPSQDMATTLRFADKLPPNLDIKSEKEKEYILGEKYIFRGFGKEGEAKPEDLIEPPEPIPDGWWQCQHCGKANASYVGSCGCGCDKSGNMSIGNPEQKQQDDVAVKMLPQRLSCPSCGKQVGPEANFCQYCGAKCEI